MREMQRLTDIIQGLLKLSLAFIELHKHFFLVYKSNRLSWGNLLSADPDQEYNFDSFNHSFTNNPDGKVTCIWHKHFNTSTFPPSVWLPNLGTVRKHRVGIKLGGGGASKGSNYFFQSKTFFF